MNGLEIVLDIGKETEYTAWASAWVSAFYLGREQSAGRVVIDDYDFVGKVIHDGIYIVLNKPRVDILDDGDIFRHDE